MRQYEFHIHYNVLIQNQLKLHFLQCRPSEKQRYKERLYSRIHGKPHRKKGINRIFLPNHEFYSFRYGCTDNQSDYLDYKLEFL